MTPPEGVLNDDHELTDEMRAETEGGSFELCYVRALMA